MPRVVLAGDTTLTGVARALQKRLRSGTSKWSVVDSDFNSWQREAIDPQSQFHQTSPEILIYILSPRVLTDLPDIEAEFDVFLRGLTSVAGATRVLCTTVAVHPHQPQPLIETLAGQRIAAVLNTKLLSFQEQNSWFDLIDQTALFASHGVCALTDARYETIGRMYYSPKGAELLAEALSRAVSALTTSPKKVLVLDLDNTLWSGVLGEDGIDGIGIGGDGVGYAHLRFQRAIKTLARSGVLLAICSKNDEADALGALAEHPDMALRIGDFCAHRINWESKCDNLRGLAEELNLGLDSFVLFDDSPFEREQVRRLAPEIDVIEVPADPADYVRALADYPGFDRFRVTEEDRSRSRQYLEQAQREALKRQSESLEEFYISLQMHALIECARETTLPRVHQLIWKTNQFNLTTQRYDEPELRSMMKSGERRIVTLRLSDKLGESGLAGVLIVSTAGLRWEIDNLLLSCRILGRTVEYGLIRFIAQKARAAGACELAASFIPSARNHIAAGFLQRAGFQMEERSGKWVLTLDKADTLIPKDFVSITDKVDELVTGE